MQSMSSLLAVFFASALPARSASRVYAKANPIPLLCLGAACTECIREVSYQCQKFATLPRRCLHGVHQGNQDGQHIGQHFASALPARSASTATITKYPTFFTLPRRCLHGVHLPAAWESPAASSFASALPARSASLAAQEHAHGRRLCLGAACTECIKVIPFLFRKLAAFASALPARSASIIQSPRSKLNNTLPRRCLHGVHLFISLQIQQSLTALPRRCLHGVHRCTWCSARGRGIFASALPARSASV